MPLPPAMMERMALCRAESGIIGSRSIKRMSATELVTWRDKYRAEVFAEDNKERRRNGYNAGRLVARL